MKILAMFIHIVASLSFILALFYSHVFKEDVTQVQYAYQAFIGLLVAIYLKVSAIAIDFEIKE